MGASTEMSHDDSADQIRALNVDLTQQTIEKAKALCGPGLLANIRMPAPGEMEPVMEELRKSVEIQKRDTERVLSR